MISIKGILGRVFSLFFLLLCLPAFTDNIHYNFYNNHGVVGLINMPSARFYDESSHGITSYFGDPDTKVTLTASPFNRLEASFFYTSNNELKYCGVISDPVCSQDLKDKGFNVKFRIKEEGKLPAIAIGINDLAGTGLYASEYIVSSYGIDNLDFHFGLAWGALNGSKSSFKNPLGYIYDGFKTRPGPVKIEDTGQFEPGRYFSGESVSPFFGVAYIVNKNLVISIENDTTLTPGRVNYEKAKSDYSLGLNYKINQNFDIGLSFERGNFLSFKFIYKNNPLSIKPKTNFKAASTQNNDNSYTKLIKNLENNGIGVNKIIETSESIGIELTQFIHPNLNNVEEIIKAAKLEAGINKDIKKDLRIANLQAYSEYDSEYERNSKLIYERDLDRIFNTDTNFVFRPFLASREEFFKGAILIENNSELIFSQNFFFSSNLKYTIADNFDDLRYPAKDLYLEQVRSDVKDYLKNFDNGIIIGRAQFDFHISHKKNHHLMFSGGILEEMFSGYGIEYLYFKQDTNYALGFEIFDVAKRDYEMRFGTLDYKNTTSAINFYYRNYGSIPFDSKISFGEYLGGDKGITLEASRSYINGVKFGVYATFTDVSFDQFGEGSFDKGIFFNIPIYGNLINYTWSPLTKDPGARLNRKHTLYDLLVKFKPIN